MKAITILQPYAQLIAVGAKRYETRSWATKHRGPIAIHAGKRKAHDFDAYVRHAIADALPWNGYGVFEGYISGLPHGAVIAVAELVECWKVTRMDKHGAALLVNRPDRYADRLVRVPADELLFGDFSPGRFAWELTDVKMLKEPVPARGRQGLWTLPPEIEAEIMRRIEK
jgi:hypothetical protein